MAGDWDNDGKDDIGVYRPKPPATPTTSRWFLAKLPTRPTSVPLPSWRWFAYGAPADVPVVADWNGDGRDEVGVYRAQAPTSRWYTANVPAASTGVHLPSTRQFLYGLPTEKPVAGDWDGAGGRFGTITPGVVANETWRLTNGLGASPRSPSATADQLQETVTRRAAPVLVTGNSRLAWPFGSIRGVLSSGEVVNRPSDARPVTWQRADPARVPPLVTESCTVVPVCSDAVPPTTTAVNGPTPWSELNAKNPRMRMTAITAIMTVAWPWIGLGSASPAGL